MAITTVQRARDTPQVESAEVLFAVFDLMTLIYEHAMYFMKMYVGLPVCQK